MGRADQDGVAGDGDDAAEVVGGGPIGGREAGLRRPAAVDGTHEDVGGADLPLHADVEVRRADHGQVARDGDRAAELRAGSRVAGEQPTLLHRPGRHEERRCVVQRNDGRRGAPPWPWPPSSADQARSRHERQGGSAQVARPMVRSGPFSVVPSAHDRLPTSCAGSPRCPLSPSLRSAGSTASP